MATSHQFCSLIPCVRVIKTDESSIDFYLNKIKRFYSS